MFSKLVISSSKRFFSKESKYAGLSKEEFTFLAEKTSPYIKEFLKPTIISLQHGKLTMVLHYRDDFMGNPMIPCLHGGVTASIIDHVGGFSAWSTLENSFQRVSTIDLRIDYLKPALCEDMICEGAVDDKSVGNKFIRSSVICWNKDKTSKVAIGRGLFNIYTKSTDISQSLKEAVNFHKSKDVIS